MIQVNERFSFWHKPEKKVIKSLRKMWPFLKLPNQECIPCEFKAASFNLPKKNTATPTDQIKSTLILTTALGKMVAKLLWCSKISAAQRLPSANSQKGPVLGRKTGNGQVSGSQEAPGAACLWSHSHHYIQQWDSQVYLYGPRRNHNTRNLSTTLTQRWQ